MSVARSPRPTEKTARRPAAKKRAPATAAKTNGTPKVATAAAAKTNGTPKVATAAAARTNGAHESASVVAMKANGAPGRTNASRNDHMVRETIGEMVAGAFAGITAGSAAADRSPLPAALVEKKRERARRRIVDALEAEGRELSAERAAAVRKLVRDWAAKGFDEGFKAAEDFEVGCFADADIARARTADDREALFDAMVAKHRAAVVRDFGWIEIRGLQMSERVYQALDVAYVPLWIRDETRKPEVIKAGKGMEIQTIPRVSVPELLQSHERTLLVGAPGSGKTTIVAYVAAQAASGQLGELTGWTESPVPFVVPVRSLATSRLDAETIAGVGCELDADFVRAALEQKRALILVDGLDEARKGPAALTAVLRTFVKEHPGNRVLVTTRPAANGGSERIEIPGFATATLEAMTRDEVYVFIDKWCLAAEQSLQKDPAKAKNDARLAAEDLKGRVQSSRPVERLAQTPLICSVLCIVHRFLGQRIPERRAALYEVCTNVLLYEWDQAKFPPGATIGQLDAPQKRILLGGLARWMHEKRIAEVARHEVVRIFAERLPALDRKPEDAEKIIREVQDRSGILVERRPGFFAFSHLTFQEYLTAVEIVGAGEILSLVGRHEDRWWHEVTVLAAGLPAAEATNLIEALLEQDKKKNISSATLLAAQCVATAIHLPASLRAEVQQRIRPLVPPTTEGATLRLVELGEIAGPLLLRAIADAGPSVRARICATLGEMKYEPASAALIGLLDDERKTEQRIASKVGNARVGWALWDSVSGHAALALFNISVSSPFTRSAFKEALARGPRGAIEFLRKLRSWMERDKVVRHSIGREAADCLDTILEVIPASMPEKPASKPARVTG